MMQNRIDLAGKSALITGAAHRIGAAIVYQLHAEGMDILLHYRNSKEAAERLKQALEADRPNSVWLLQADLHQPDSYQHLISEVEAKCRRLDLLVNNASSFYPTPVESASHAQWDDLIGSNLKAPFFLSQAAAPLLRKTEGCIINLVDIHARRPLKNYPIYSVAKAGNAMLVKSLARELGPKVRVNGIAPGVILWPEQGLSEQQRQTILDRTALKRAGAPEEIARILLFLYRDAHYVTGQIIAVDGGRTLQL
ncbi:MAG: pteridine reductase [Candidatus Thiodiazotropha sp. (ex Lucinoma aequizonata)]|nr:pteridine reductase [Candidatus Thiodiazotropha sp. (ex Lucinoma aequizonata)]MCU7889362.1 pteridine reductase [Candidatus Thiodiazotropha sp. (ex Lucinoma aequizonata)]MCU7894191.1 pteridine reductase [Candidatus Thiodiazotropha sp. (ex Lucinoma aequizonata)]MCU7898607.1 pteridine reductase [Candidatus Thiodiazotropha sp. (ex Lucinoma aequizonata)]MCU7902359.1 pteridine reductase [Candidatus Thiodiazotropha sp. (ex Lucinoma aequizonata)]